MRILRYVPHKDAVPGWSVLQGDEVMEADGDLADGVEPGASVGALRNLQLLAPCSPSKVICVGRNYAAHVKEMGRDWPERPFVLLKGPNAVVGHGADVLRPSEVERFDFEGELAVVLRRRARDVDADDWRSVVAGYTCANDLTARDWQEADGQWARAKSADTFCPLGPWIETEVDDPEALRLRTRVNGEIHQDSRTDDLIFGIGELLAFVTQALTLEPGDVVLTGTPGGVGPLQVGDVVEVEIESIGVLRNRVEARR